MSGERDRAANAYFREREEREEAERARCTSPDGRYLALAPTNEALVDCVDRAINGHGEWMRGTPSGYWIDLIETARELLAARAALEAADRLAEALEREHYDTDRCPACAACARAAHEEWCTFAAYRAAREHR